MGWSRERVWVFRERIAVMKMGTKWSLVCIDVENKTGQSCGEQSASKMGILACYQQHQ
jgi:hypothetical protein